MEKIGDERVLVLLAQQGDESAFRRLYENHYEMVYHIAFRYSGSRPDAEDILQETFIKAFKAIRKFDFKVGNRFGSWLYRISVNCSMDHHRKRKKRKYDRTASFAEIHGEPEAADASPERAAVANQALRRLEDALAGLSPRQRLVFDLRHLQHQAFKEIAESLQCSQSTVKKQLERAVAKLRSQLEPLWREE